MRILKDYFRLALFLMGALIGLQIPAFMDQYGQTLNAHRLEAEAALDQFQDEAARFFDSDLDALIRYYRNNPDPVFQEGGQSIAAIVNRYLQLSLAYEDFTSSWYRAFIQVSVNPYPEITEEVWDSYDYSVLLTVTAIAWAVAISIVFAIVTDAVLELGIVICRSCLRRTRRRRSPPTS